MLLTQRRWAALSDLELIRVATHDTEAFAELVRRHQDFVHGVAVRIVRDHSLAEDLAQETFVRAYSAKDRFRGDAAVRTWLYRIATNLALNAVTRRQEYPAGVLPERMTEAQGPEDEFEVRALRAHLREAIAGLAEGLRTPLTLRERDEMSYQGIADATGLPLNTVRTRILRARRALRSQVEAWQ